MPVAMASVSMFPVPEQGGEGGGGAGRGKEGKGAGRGGGGGGEVEAIKRGNWFDGCRSEFRFIFLCVSRGHFLVGEITERNESNAMESNGIQLDFSLSPPLSLSPWRCPGRF